MTKKEAIICIDAGGTTTKINVYDLNNQIIDSLIVESASPAITKDLEFKSIDDALELLVEKIRKDYILKNITMGISALGVVIDVCGLEEKFTKKYNCPVYIKTDCLIALYSVVCKGYEDILYNKIKDGILVLGGTGSAIAGIKNGKYYQVGGYGQIIGERGSAYSLVHQLCLKLIDKYQNNNELSYLDKCLLSSMNITEVPHLKAIYYLQTKGDIASHANIITSLAEEGNLDALVLLQEEARVIVENIKTLIRYCDFGINGLLGFKGGLFKYNGLITNMVVDLLNQEGYNFEFVINNEDPIIGAYYLARAMVK